MAGGSRLAVESTGSRCGKTWPFALRMLLVFIAAMLSMLRVVTIITLASPRHLRLPTTNSNLTAGRKKNDYVVISSTVDAFARKADYDFLAPLTARNWHMHGFIPILIVVGSSQSKLDTVLALWKQVLPRNAIIVPLVVVRRPDHQSPITVAQMVRHYASLLLPSLPDDAWLRISDADMMIMEASPFLPPRRGIDIDIFNGRCCLGENVVIKSDVAENATETNHRRSCNQYPMHSVGMKVSLWRELFALPCKGDDIKDCVLSGISSHVHNLFGFPYGPATVRHGDSRWSMDQVLLGCTIDDAVDAGYTLNLAPGPKARIHIGDALVGKHTDAHLAGFRLDNNFHDRWFQSFVMEAGDLGRGTYRYYINSWRDYLS